MYAPIRGSLFFSPELVKLVKGAEVRAGAALAYTLKNLIKINVL